MAEQLGLGGHHHVADPLVDAEHMPVRQQHRVDQEQLGRRAGAVIADQLAPEHGQGGLELRIDVALSAEPLQEEGARLQVVIGLPHGAVPVLGRLDAGPAADGAQEGLRFAGDAVLALGQPSLVFGGEDLEVDRAVASGRHGQRFALGRHYLRPPIVDPAREPAQVREQAPHRARRWSPSPPLLQRRADLGNLRRLDVPPTLAAALAPAKEAGPPRPPRVHPHHGARRVLAELTDEAADRGIAATVAVRRRAQPAVDHHHLDALGHQLLHHRPKRLGARRCPGRLGRRPQRGRQLSQLRQRSLRVQVPGRGDELSVLLNRHPGQTQVARDRPLAGARAQAIDQIAEIVHV